MREVPADLLARDAHAGARLVLRVQLSALRRAARRLARDRDDEALHDVRTAARRLRTSLRVYGHLLPRRRVEAALATLASLSPVTSVARDAEVSLELFRALATPPGPAAQRVTDRLRRRAGKRCRKARRAVGAALPHLVDHLRPALERYEVAVEARPPRTFDAEARAAIERVSERLSCAVLDTRDPADAHALHRIRLRAKAVRDVLHPLVAAVPAFAAPMDVLARVQHQLGADRDRQVLAERLAREARRAPRRLREEITAIATAVRPRAEAPREDWLAALESTQLLVAGAGQEDEVR
jgi:CHAD domain-containing protein